MELLRQKFETLRDLYVNELRNLFSGETQLVEALPKMADGATTPALKQAFTDHWPRLACMWSAWIKFSKIFQKGYGRNL
jgi:uncharacterized protein DUF892